MNKQQQQDLFHREPAPWDLDDAEEVLVATVVFSNVPFGPFDYRVPDPLQGQVQAGHRLRVPLGRGNRRSVGYCVAVAHRRTDASKLKEVAEVVDPQPLLGPTMLDVTRWMSEHYVCAWGQALEAVVPAGVRSQAGTREKDFLSVPTNVAARLTQLKLPPKQAAVLQFLAGSPQPLTTAELSEAAGCSAGPIQALRRKGLLEVHRQRVQTAEVESLEDTDDPGELKLNADQQKGLDAINQLLDVAQHGTILLHGITGSGKTEVYIRAIQRVLSFGRQAIVLVPEISLTPQTRRRFRSRFDHVAVLHSHLTPSERHWHWQRIARGEIQVVVGARSAVFAPTPNLGLIILDEEHDSSFKQDSMPRYHARQVASRRAQLDGIPLVLGSATPALETWHAALRGSVQRVSMPTRVLDRPLPVVTTIDLRLDENRRYNRGAISRPLGQAIRQAVSDGGQVMLLLNRRGFSTNIQCPACGHVVKCPDCDISLTHHREGDRALCHYCDYKILAPPRCPECGFEGIRYSGMGTQKLEMEVRSRFSDIPCLRVDSDTMQKPGAHETAMARFRDGEIKILLGTQMIAKGLDFPNVTLVGVINADTALHFPDFRAAERTFQLVTQVAGRTGRGAAGGRVLVQTFSPEHPAIQAAIRHDYQQFANGELPVRKRFGYPPLSRMIRFIVRGEQEAQTERFADALAERLEPHLEKEGLRLLGPAPAPIARIRRLYRYHVVLLGTDPLVLREAAVAIRDSMPPADGIQWVMDVDPVDLL